MTGTPIGSLMMRHIVPIQHWHFIPIPFQLLHGVVQCQHGRSGHLLVCGRQHAWTGSLFNAIDFLLLAFRPCFPAQSMANATLTVNEFRSLTLPTEVPVSWPLSYTVLLILSFLLLCAFVALCMLYLFFSKKFSAKNRVQTLDKMAVRKKALSAWLNYVHHAHVFPPKRL